jgi:hypothetical protein
MKECVLIVYLYQKISSSLARSYLLSTFFPNRRPDDRCYGNVLSAANCRAARHVTANMQPDAREAVFAALLIVQSVRGHHLPLLPCMKRKLIDRCAAVRRVRQRLRHIRPNVEPLLSVTIPLLIHVITAC